MDRESPSRKRAKPTTARFVGSTDDFRVFDPKGRPIAPETRKTLGPPKIDTETGEDLEREERSESDAEA